MRTSLILIPALFLVFGTFPAVQAQPETNEVEWHAREQRAQELIAEGGVRRKAAKQMLNEVQAGCARKLLVNQCRNAAYAEYVAAHREALRIENEGQAISRQVQQARLLERDQRREAERDAQRLELPKRESEQKAAREADEAQRAALLADKQRKSRAGERRKVEDARRLAERQAAHDARVAKKMRAAAERQNSSR